MLAEGTTTGSGPAGGKQPERGMMRRLLMCEKDSEAVLAGLTSNVMHTEVSPRRVVT